MKIELAKAQFQDNTRVFSQLVKKFGMRVLKAQGAFIRTAARSSIKKSISKKLGTKSRPSEPGKPPRGHGRQTLKKSIIFAADKQTNTVVVGPQLVFGRVKTGSGKTVPNVLEFGGKSTRVSYVKKGGKPTRKVRRVTIKARPYMRPALIMGLYDLRRKWETVK